MILVCGGAGYVGSHAVKILLERGMEVVVVDNLATGHLESVDKRAKFYQVDVRDEEDLSKVFEENKIDSVMHFCANSLVGESMTKPNEYFDNNVGGAIALLKVMNKHGIKKIVFSSTAAVYGEPEETPITENCPTKPLNPYGESKLIMEKMFRWADEAYGIKYVSLRYFNVAGAYKTGEIGEAHTTETHLIPLVLQVPLEKREKIFVFGDDYPTKDGTCIRDYIHIIDLIEAHILALDYLEDKKQSNIFNLGSGEGFSVKEIVEFSRKVTSHTIPQLIQDRRAGDPAVLIASSEKAQKELGWKVKHTFIEEIIEDAWNWHQKNPNGYKK